MPTVNRQNPKATTNSRTPTSASAVDRITGIGFDGEAGIKLLLYGQSGSGKTTTWATFPKPILVLVCSGGDNPGELRSIDTPEYRKVIKQVTLRSSLELPELVAHAAGRFQTLVLDHATGFQDKVLAELLNLTELPVQKTWGLASQQQYGQCTLQCKEHLRRLLGFDGNVVVVAQEREFKGEEDSELIMPTVGAGLTPSLTGWLNTAVDYICQTFKRPKAVTSTRTVAGREVVTKKLLREVEYCLRTGPDPVYTTKFRRPKGLPLPHAIVDPDYDKIRRVIAGELLDGELTAE